MAKPEAYFFFIRSKLSNKVLNVQGNSKDPGADVVLWTKKDEDNDNQIWYKDHVTGTIRCKANKMCLELKGK